ncbi:MAG: hypothetical protein V4585_18410 [Bacteroidota bacterium]
MKQSEGIIYLSEKRKCFQTEIFRSFITLPNTNTLSPIEDLVKFADNTLAAQKSQIILVEDNYSVILMPIVGAIEVTCEGKNEFINAGQAAFYNVRSEDTILIENPYETELVNYLEIWLKSTEETSIGNITADFDLEKHKNELIEVGNLALQAKVFMGKFSGREEGEMNMQEHKFTFVYIINGAFEVQNRLVEMGSALTLWDLEVLDFEGLAGENIFLVMTF